MLCDEEPKTMHHLLVGCVISLQGIKSWCGVPDHYFTRRLQVLLYLVGIGDKIMSSGPLQRSNLDHPSLRLLYLEHRNARTFDNRQPSLPDLVHYPGQSAHLGEGRCQGAE